jgi:hypothetical protein
MTLIFERLSDGIRESQELETLTSLRQNSEAATGEQTICGLMLETPSATKSIL